MESTMLDNQEHWNMESGVLQRDLDQKLCSLHQSEWKRIFENDRYITNIDVRQYFRQLNAKNENTKNEITNSKI